MNNKEIDIRLRKLSEAIVKRSAKTMPKNKTDLGIIAYELELLNMSAMGIMAMLGEIAKRLPEGNKGDQ